MKQRILSITMIFVCMLALMPTVVFADNSKLCPAGITQLDCDAIVGNWPDWVPISSAGICAGDDSVLTGTDNIQKAFNFFTSKGLTDVSAAAVVGNLMQESSLNPTIMQKGGNSKNPADADPLGWGIAQWSPGSKISGIASNLGITGQIYELSTQLDIVYAEMQGTTPTGYSNFLPAFSKITDIDQATEFFRANFEGGTPGNRQLYAEQAQKEYGGSSSGAVSGVNASCASPGAINCSNPSNGNTTSNLSGARQQAVCIAEAELASWKSGQLKPGGTEPYDFYKYSQGRNEEWCADFASWVYNQAGYPLSTAAKNGNVPSVDGVIAIGRSSNGFTYHEASGYTPQPGDLAIHKSGQSHVNIVVAVNINQHSMVLLGGNQDGTTTANNTSKVSEYTVNGFSGTDGLTGYVSPDK